MRQQFPKVNVIKDKWRDDVIIYCEECQNLSMADSDPRCPICYPQRDIDFFRGNGREVLDADKRKREEARNAWKQAPKRGYGAR